MWFEMGIRPYPHEDETLLISKHRVCKYGYVDQKGVLRS